MQGIIVSAANVLTESPVSKSLGHHWWIFWLFSLKQTKPQLNILGNLVNFGKTFTEKMAIAEDFLGTTTCGL